jgi:aspartyl-tRNA(Asn)/glutamyl-tRNA(Gln) amidotransferase subunit A
MSPLHWQSASALALAIQQRRLSPVELIEAALERISQWDPAIHAFIRCDQAGARSAARQAETEIGSGLYRGPLQGMPIGIKDVIDMRGLPTTCHSRLRLDHEATADAAVVAQLRQAGAIILGKLALHEFALGGPSFDLPFPPARNPWNTEHHPGGSSSGCAAALAAGLLPLAIGTDTSGSIRHPASACGVVGLKPTYGRVARAGVFPLAATLDHVGPMARSVDDVALVLETIACSARAEPIGKQSAPGPRWLSALRDAPNMAGLRIGYVRHFHERDMVADPEVAAALDTVAVALADAGAAVQAVELPDLNSFSAISRIILQSEAWATHAHWLRTRPDQYGQRTRHRLLPGAFLTAEDYVRSQRLRSALLAAVQTVFREVDVLLCASSMDPACRLDDPIAIESTYSRQARTPFNVTGHPAIAMMAGLSGMGLPLSVQFVGRHFDEATVLRVAKAWELIGGWQERHPLSLDRVPGSAAALQQSAHPSRCAG